jgi:hypothetical protein
MRARQRRILGNTQQHTEYVAALASPSRSASSANSAQSGGTNAQSALLLVSQDSRIRCASRIIFFPRASHAKPLIWRDRQSLKVFALGET